MGDMVNTTPSVSLPIKFTSAHFRLGRFGSHFRLGGSGSYFKLSHLETQAKV